jgi:hypothetical protein
MVPKNHPAASLVDRALSIRPMLYTLLAVWMLLTASPARSEPVPGSMDAHWNEGALNCATNSQPPLQVHQYNTRTFILRQNLCTTFEAPFMYLLIGSTKALRIDTGDVADPDQMPLAKTVMQLLQRGESAKLPLLVVHTHRHLDHRAGDDEQLLHLSMFRWSGLTSKAFAANTASPTGRTVWPGSISVSARLM